MREKSPFVRGLVDGLPIAVGYLSVAFAFGIYAVGSGLTMWEATLISVTNMTSAGQLAGVPIIAAGGSLLEMAASQLVINLRYALMSVSLSQRLDGSMTVPHRMAVAFCNTDEIFAVAVSRPNLVGWRYLYGLILVPALGWNLGTFIGAAAGDLLPAFVTTALGIAIYGMFLAIIVPRIREDRPTALCILLSAALSCLCRYLPPLSMIPQGFVIIICAVIASAVLAAVAPIDVPEEVESRA